MVESKQFGAFGCLNIPLNRGTAKKIIERCIMGEKLQNTGEWNDIIFCSLQVSLFN